MAALSPVSLAKNLLERTAFQLLLRAPKMLTHLPSEISEQTPESTGLLRYQAGYAL